MTRNQVAITSLVLCLGLSGCGGESLQDLQDYVSAAKSQPQAGIKKLPSIPEYEPIPFEGLNLADPFFPRRPVMTGVAAGKVDIPVSPDAKRPKEHLEQFALDQLKITGFVMDPSKRPVAFVQAPDRRVHMVSLGQHLGTNFGKVTKVNEAGLVLTERYFDAGAWQTREVSLLANAK